MVLIPKIFTHNKSDSNFHSQQKKAVRKNTIAGVLAPTDLASVTRADLVVDASTRPHPHSLKLARVATAAAFDACDGDGIVIPEDLIAHASRTAPAAQLDTTPWFVHLTEMGSASRVIAAGARRLWLHGATGQQVAALREELSPVWRSEMGPVALGGGVP